MTQPSPALQRQLIVLRHAKSSWSDAKTADFDRPLNDRGRAAAKLMGHKLRDENVMVDLVFASTAVRVQQTLELLLPAWQWNGTVVSEKRLYLAPPESIVDLVAALDSDWQRVMIVGHNPGLSQLVGWLTGNSVDMPTAAIALLYGQGSDWPTAIRNRPWQQQAFWKPKEL